MGRGLRGRERPPRGRRAAEEAATDRAPERRGQGGRTGGGLRVPRGLGEGGARRLLFVSNNPNYTPTKGIKRNHQIGDSICMSSCG